MLQETRPNYAEGVDAKALDAALRGRVKGEVRFDAGYRALYATDGSNYRQPPIGVVLPKDADDVIATVEECRRFGAPVLPRGGGTSLAGQCCNVAVVIDMSKYMNRVLEIDPERRIARVQPGAILDTLRDAAEAYHLTFAPDPATHNHNTLGGMIGNNSCGVHSVMGGRTADNIHELEVLTYEGLRMRVGLTSDEEYEQIVAAGGRRAEIYRELRAIRDRHAGQIRARYPDIPRRVSGYNLDELLPEKGFQVARALVGTEGTCVLVLEATVNLVHSPPARSLVVLGYPDVYTAGDHIPQIMSHKPLACEGLDDALINDMRLVDMHPGDLELLPEGGGWLLVEVGGEDKQEADENARKLMDALAQDENPPAMKLFDQLDQEKRIWEIRESGLGATAHVPAKRDTWPGWEDSAVPPDKVGDYLRDLRALYQKHGYECALYGHFGQGCIHTRIDFDLETAEGIRRFRRFLEEAADTVVRYGGSLSGEHGDGQARGELLARMYGEELVEAFRRFKLIWDPQWKMNPGKVVDPYRVDENLRLGTDYAPPQPKTHFQYPDDGGSFANAALRCVGVGKCRRLGGGTMCPSFMATREEMHSTRGRARLLYEMLNGGVIKGGWREEAVKEALDLCLACKGCRGDCPVNVDMATYKAEFMSHYWKGRIRPLNAYAFGHIDIWSRFAAHAPRLINAVTQTAPFSTLAKAMVRMPQQRRIPVYALQTLQAWYGQRGGRHSGGESVILWPDTFNNYFFPETGQAAVEVLEAAGFEVLIPRQHVCCGRPLYDFGMLGRAKRLLQRTMTQFRREINAGVPIVGLEPACTAVFRDELVNLFPHDEVAKRLSKQTFTLGEFLQKRAPDFRPPRLERKALVHMHCNHKAVLQTEGERALLERMGLDFEVLDSGCCGMAGSFGFERDKFEVSIRAGERVLLPAVREAAADTLLIADGFACREQIAQTTDRRALHTAQLVRLALEKGERNAGSLAS